MVSQLQCWLYRSFYEIARSNTPVYAGLCRGPYGSMQCSVSDGTTTHNLTGWDQRGFLNYKANRTAWAVFVDRQFPELARGFKANLYYMDPNPHASVSVSGSAKWGGYTIYGEAWKAMTGFYNRASGTRASDTAASTWMGAASDGKPVCGGEALSLEYDDDVFLEEGLYVRTRPAPGMSGLEVSILEVLEGTGSSRDDIKVLAEYTLPGDAWVSSTILESAEIASAIKGTRQAGGQFKIELMFGNKWYDVTGHTPRWHMQDPIVLPADIEVPLDFDAAGGFDYNRVSDDTPSKWVVVAPATKTGDTALSVTRSGVLRATAPPEASETGATNSKQTAFQKADMASGLNEYISNYDGNAYMWASCLPGDRLQLFAGITSASWVDNYTSGIANEHAISLVFETGADRGECLEVSDPTDPDDTKVISEATLTEIRAVTTTVHEDEDDFYTWSVSMQVEDKATGKYVRMGPITVKTPGSGWADYVKTQKIDVSGYEDIKATLEFLPAAGGGYGLRAISRLYAGSETNGWTSIPGIGSVDLVEVSVSESSDGKLHPIPTQQELALVIVSNSATYVLNSKHTTEGGAGSRRSWSLAAGLSASAQQLQEAVFVSETSASFVVDPQQLEIADAVAWITQPVAGDLMGFEVSKQNPNDSKETAGVLYSRDRKPSEDEVKVRHPSGWYMTVRDGFKTDTRYTDQKQKTKRFILKQYNSQGELEREWFDYTIPWDVAKNPAGDDLYRSVDRAPTTQVKAPSADYKWITIGIESGRYEISKTGLPNSWTDKIDENSLQSTVYMNDYNRWALKDSHDCIQLLKGIPSPLFECTDYKLQLQSDRVTINSWFENTATEYGACDVVHPLLVLKYPRSYVASDNFKAVGWNSYKDGDAFAWWNWQHKKGYVYGKADRKDISENVGIDAGAIDLFYKGGGVISLKMAATRIIVGGITDKTARWAEGENHPVSGLDEMSGDIYITASDKSVKTGSSSIIPKIAIYAGSRGYSYEFDNNIDQNLLGTVFAEGDKLSITQPGNIEGLIVSIYSNSGDLKRVLFFKDIGSSIKADRYFLPCGFSITIDINWDDKVSPQSTSGHYNLFQGTKSFHAHTWMGVAYNNYRTTPTYNFDFTTSSTAVEPLYSNTALGAAEVGALSLYTVDTSSTPVVDAWVKASLSGLKAKTEEFQLKRGQQVGFAWKNFISASRKTLSCIVKISDEWSSATAPVTPTTLETQRVGRRPLQNKAKNRSKIIGWLY